MNAKQRAMKKWRKKYPWRRAYDGAKGRCKHHPSYCRRGIKCFLTEDQVKYLWFRDKAYEMKRPSIDRINGHGNYEMSNCRFRELSENQRDIQVKNYAKVRPWKWRSCSQYDLKGNLIKKWKSQTEASLKTGIDVRLLNNCLRGRKKTCKGYLWKNN